MRDCDLDLVREQPLFRVLRPRPLRALFRDAFLRDHPARAELLREGEAAAFLHIIVEGQVELFAARRGRETTMDVLAPGQCFFLAAAVVPGPNIQSARTLTASRLLHVPVEAVRAALAADARFARAVAETLTHALRDAVNDLRDQKLRSSLERLADWLLRYDDATGHTHRFALPYDKRVLAARLGMAPEVLSRAFAALVSCRVQVRGPNVRLRDPGALRQLTEGSTRGCHALARPRTGATGSCVVGLTAPLRDGAA